MPKFLITETIHSEKVATVRLGTATAGDQYGYAENGKALKLGGESAYVLAAAGDAIEAIQSSSNYPEQGTVDGYAIGGIYAKGNKAVTFDGLQATPGVGDILIGDYVLVGTVVPKGTDLPGPLKVVKATNQASAKTAPFKARVLSLGTVGTGAAGTTGTVELI